MLKYWITAAVVSGILGLTGCEEDTVNASIAENIDVNQMGPNNQHIIFWEIERRDADRVHAFLDAGVDINIRGFMGMTPAIYAATSDGWDMVLLFATRGADLSIVAKNGFSVQEIGFLSELLNQHLEMNTFTHLMNATSPFYKQNNKSLWFELLFYHGSPSLKCNHPVTTRLAYTRAPEKRS